MREALREAQAALAAGEIPIGAVIVSRGRVIGRGHNMTERLIDTTAHAEMVAITAATEAIGGKYLTDCTLYVTVEPCPMCAGALNWAQVDKPGAVGAPLGLRPVGERAHHRVRDDVEQAGHQHQGGGVGHRQTEDVREEQRESDGHDLPQGFYLP